MKHEWVIYDGRAALGDPDDAQVLDTADSVGEAIRCLKIHPGSVAYRYELHPGNRLLNEAGPFDIAALRREP